MLLEVKNLIKRFEGIVAVNDLSFSVDKGMIVGLIGPNGAGKTTVLNLISGVLRPTSGRIIFRGSDITNKKTCSIAALGLVRSFQSNILFDDETCLKNIVMAHSLQRRANFFEVLFGTSANQEDEKAIRNSSKKILEWTGFGKIGDQIARSLPHGRKRILGLSMALATNPKFLLLDEPVTGMTYEEVDTCKNLIQQMKSQGITVIVVEHNLRFVMDLCDWIIVMHFGNKLAEGVPSDIRNNKNVVDAYLSGKGGEKFYLS